MSKQLLQKKGKVMPKTQITLIKVFQSEKDFFSLMRSLEAPRSAKN